MQQERTKEMAQQDQSGASYQHTGGTDEPAYTLPCSAEELYEARAKYRQQVIDMARYLASITIPSVYPPMAYRTGDMIDGQNQSANAMFVNALASKMMFMALPPDRPVVRFEPIEHKLGAELKANPKLWTAIQIGLNNLEQEHRKRFEATNLRSAYVQSLKQAIVAGNWLWEHLKLDTPVVHQMENYIVVRNKQGEQLLVILKRCVELLTMPKRLKDQLYAIKPDLKARMEGTGGAAKTTRYDETVDIYAVCKLRADGGGKPYWEYWEEYEGELLDGTQFEADFEDVPLWAGWMIPVYGQDWGRSYCEEYLGDLKKVDALSKSVDDGAAVASLILLFLKAGSRTSAKQIRNAGNMTLLSGQADDLTAFHLDKTADFSFINTELEATIKRLGRAFLLVSSVQRKGERVTAEEWKEMTDEINEATGGLYAELAQSYQRHVIRRAVSLHNEEDKQLPKLPPGIFRVAVITGYEAMGRSIEGENLMRGTQGIVQLMGPQVAARYIDPLEFIRRVYVSENVKQDGLVLSQDTVDQKDAQMKQDMMRQTLMEKGTGPAISAVAKASPMLNQAVTAEQNDPTKPPPGGVPALPPTTGQA